MELNHCFRIENPASWAARRRGRSIQCGIGFQPVNLKHTGWNSMPQKLCLHFDGSQMQLLELFSIDLAGGFGHQVAGLLRLGESDDFPNVIKSGE